MKKRKILSILIALIIMIPSVAFAFTPFKTDPVEPDGFEEPAGKILGVIRAIGYAVAVGMLLFVGIKYMTSSADEKANTKQMSINYLIGAFIIFGATGIFDIIIRIVENMK